MRIYCVFMNAEEYICLKNTLITYSFTNGRRKYERKFTNEKITRLTTVLWSSLGKHRDMLLCTVLYKRNIVVCECKIPILAYLYDLEAETKQKIHYSVLKGHWKGQCEDYLLWDGKGSTRSIENKLNLLANEERNGRAGHVVGKRYKSSLSRLQENECKRSRRRPDRRWR